MAIIRYPLILGITLLLLSACSDALDPMALPPEQRSYDTSRLLSGEQLFIQYCASCHGAGATGDPNWRQRDSNGRFPPPPLNGSAHTWHHPLAQLRHTIKNGGPPGVSNMPAWGSTLSDEQIDDIILWFQALWPDQVYEEWYGIEQRARS